jgi:hypothetical protein
MIPTNDPLPRNTTYLYLEFLTSNGVDTIELFPHITHLGFGCWGDDEEGEYPHVIRRILESMPSLLLVLLVAHCQKYPADSLRGHI